MSAGPKNAKPAVVLPRIKPSAVRPAAAPPLRRHVTIDDNLMMSMAGQPAFRALLPFLKNYAAAKARCSSCGGAARARSASDQLRLQIANLNDDNRRKLKALFNSDKVTLYVPGAGSNGRRAVTF